LIAELVSVGRRMNGWLDGCMDGTCFKGLLSVVQKTQLLYFIKKSIGFEAATQNYFLKRKALAQLVKQAIFNKFLVSFMETQHPSFFK
jgi:hypothetical protein